MWPKPILTNDRCQVSLRGLVWTWKSMSQRNALTALKVTNNSFPGLSLHHSERNKCCGIFRLLYMWRKTAMSFRPWVTRPVNKAFLRCTVFAWSQNITTPKTERTSWCDVVGRSIYAIFARESHYYAIAWWCVQMLKWLLRMWSISDKSQRKNIFVCFFSCDLFISSDLV